jgi:hypothetical protein
MGIQLDVLTPADSERLQDFLLPHILAATEGGSTPQKN